MKIDNEWKILGYLTIFTITLAIVAVVGRHYGIFPLTDEVIHPDDLVMNPDNMFEYMSMQVCGMLLAIGVIGLFGGIKGRKENSSKERVKNEN